MQIFLVTPDILHFVTGIAYPYSTIVGSVPQNGKNDGSNIIKFPYLE